MRPRPASPDTWHASPEESIDGRTPIEAGSLHAGGGRPPAVARTLVPVRTLRRGAAVRHAGAGRHAARAAGARLRLVGEHAGDGHGDLRRLRAGAGVGGAARSAVHVVQDLRVADAAAAGYPQHDSQGGARPADHRLVQVRGAAELDHRVLDRGVPHPADHRARPARDRAGAAGPGALAARVALAAVHQGAAARRPALYLLGHEGGRDPGRGRRHRRRVPGLRPRPRLPDAAGAGDAGHARHVHGGDPDHALGVLLYGLVLLLEHLLVAKDARVS
jgi:hypothetical protein